MKPDKSPASSNSLLASLPEDDYSRLLPRLEPVHFPRNRILYEAGEAIHYAYFPSSGLASLLALAESGSTIEIGTVGKEGYIGVPILQRAGFTPYRVSVQMPMTALRMEAHAFLSATKREGALSEMLLRYAHVVETQLVRAVVCNLTHTVEQRLARRLLVMSDCLDSSAFEVTQEQLSIVLDRHRNRISSAGIILRDRHLIEISRGQLKIINRSGLEAAACECYQIVRDVSNRSF